MGVLPVTGRDRRDPVTAFRYLHDPVWHFAEVAPDDIVIKFEGSTMTWGELESHVARLINYLKAHGIRRGTRLAILAKNSPLSLGITMAAGVLGAATVMVNWRLAAREIQYILEDSKASLVFADTDLAPLVGGGSRTTLSVDYEPFMAELEAVAPAATNDYDINENDVVLIMYSSGTTGFPKGVMITHRSFLWAPVHRPVRDVPPPGRLPTETMVPMPFFHVGGFGAAFQNMALGRRVSILREVRVPDMMTAIEQGADLAFLAPSIVQMALDDPALMATVGKLAELRYGASPMPASLLSRALSAWPQVRFSQAYGATETSGTISELCDEDHRNPIDERVLGSAGRPLDGAEVKIVDPVTLEDAPIGANGEIWVRAPHLSSGYLDNPVATAEAFTSDGWYRTGDIGAFDEAGYLYIRDRLKDMIITGGENVYCVEVELVISAHSGVRSAAVVGVPHPKWGERPIAYVELEPGAEVTSDELARFCRDRLAGFKCPDRFLITAQLPRTSTGKIVKTPLREALLAEPQGMT